MVIILFNTGLKKSPFSTYFSSFVLLRLFCFLSVLRRILCNLHNFYHICIIIVCIIGVTNSCSHLLETIFKNIYRLIKNWLQLLIANMHSESFRVLKIPFIKKNVEHSSVKVCETFLFRESKKACSIPWNEWVFFECLERRRPNKCYL